MASHSTAYDAAMLVRAATQLKYGVEVFGQPTIAGTLVLMHQAADIIGDLQ